MAQRLGWWVVGCLAAMAGCAGVGAVSKLLPQCIGRAGNLHTALILYANDYDDKLPPTDDWMDDISPYLVGQTSNLHCPALSDPGEYGFALHSAVAGENVLSFPDPAAVVTVFESSDLARNVVGTEALLPTVARHGGKNTIAHLDGSVGGFAP